MALQRTSPPAHAREPGSIAFNLTAMFMLAVTVAIGMGYLVDREIRQAYPASRAADGMTISRTLSGRTLEIPSHWLADGADTANAFARQIDLSVSIDLDDGEGLTPIEIVLMPGTQVRSGAAMLDTVYVHQFSQTTVGGIPGLVGKPLSPGSGMSGETVWYDPLSPDPFVAKCLAPIVDGEPAHCLRALVLPSGIGAVVTFEDDALKHWRTFDSEIYRLAAAIGAT